MVFRVPSGGQAGDEGFTARWHHAVEFRGPIMSKWQEEKAERNRRSLARLTRALPRIFPSAVLSRALGRPFVPPTPRLAIDSYWGAHPLRADRLARALAARSGAPSGWSWRLGDNRKNGLPATFRMPPAPFRERAYARARLLLCVRATDLSLRLACRSVGHWDQQECSLAHRMRGRMAILDCAE